jgi:uncharacterized protein
MRNIEKAICLLEDSLYQFGFSIIKGITHYDYKVLGENIPEAPLLIASNHFGTLDPLLINEGLGKKLITLTKGSGKWFHFPHIIPNVGRINLEYGIRNVIKSIKDYSDRGYSVLIFPEGDVNSKMSEKEIREMKRGVFYFSKKLGLPVLPISLKGVEKVWPKNSNRKLPLFNGEIILNVGKEISPANGENYSPEKLREEISSLYNQY